MERVILGMPVVLQFSTKNWGEIHILKIGKRCDTGIRKFLKRILLLVKASNYMYVSFSTFCDS